MLCDVFDVVVHVDVVVIDVIRIVMLFLIIHYIIVNRKYIIVWFVCVCVIYAFV